MAPASAPSDPGAPGGLRIGAAYDLGLTDDAICDFYRRHWARPIALSREDFTRWQMREAPGAGGRNHSVAAVEGGRILAVLGATPARFRHEGRALNGAELTTWIVAPEARGRGIGGRILAHLQARYEVLTGAGITAAALPLYLKAGFTFLAHIPRFFFVADFATIIRFATASDAALALTRHRQSLAPRRASHATPCPAAALAGLSDTIAAGHFARDAERLAWRYDRHPAWRYEAFRVGNAGVVWREDRVLDTPILHLTELFGAPADLPAAIGFIEAEAEARGAAFVDATQTSGMIGAQLRARGWSSAVDGPLVELPSLFYPVELRRPPTTSLVIWAREHREKLYDFSGLCIGKGDMDLDRPTLAWYESHPA